MIANLHESMTLSGSEDAIATGKSECDCKDRRAKLNADSVQVLMDVIRNGMTGMTLHPHFRSLCLSWKHRGLTSRAGASDWSDCRETGSPS